MTSFPILKMPTPKQLLLPAVQCMSLGLHVKLLFHLRSQGKVLNSI